MYDASKSSKAWIFNVIRLTLSAKSFSHSPANLQFYLSFASNFEEFFFYDHLHHFAATGTIVRVLKEIHQSIESHSIHSSISNHVLQQGKGFRRWRPSMSFPLHSTHPQTPSFTQIAYHIGMIFHEANLVFFHRKPTRSESLLPPRRSSPSRRSAVNSSSVPRERSSASRDQSVSQLKPWRLPPVKPLVVKVPRPGIASRWESTSVWLSTFYPPSLQFAIRRRITENHHTNVIIVLTPLPRLSSKSSSTSRPVLRLRLPSLHKLLECDEKGRKWWWKIRSTTPWG